MSIDVVFNASTSHSENVKEKIEFLCYGTKVKLKFGSLVTF